MSTVITIIITTTTTEVSSNSNSSCRLLNCLNTLPSHDQRVFRSLLGHIELVRLSACCRSLRNSIRNDRLLWQALYHRDFLSGAYYDREMDFVLWCIRTDVNHPCTSDKRADLLENVDWYNTYRRRVSTENNWRFGRYNITHIDMKVNKDGVCYRNCNSDRGMFITQYDRSDKTLGHSYTLQYSPHSNLRSSNNIVYNSTLSTSPNIISLDTGNEAQRSYVLGDHYIAASPKTIKSNTHYNVAILSRKHGGVFTTFDVPTPYRVRKIKGKWVFLEHKIGDVFDESRILNAMVFDIDNSIMCPGSISDTWGVAHFYKTTNNTAIVYTARLVKDDDTDRIEWALYQFSSNNPVEQLRNGWFQLPEKMRDTWLIPYNSYDSYMLIELRGPRGCELYIMHSVASSGQSHIPRNCDTITDRHIPIPLLRAGYMFSMIDYQQPKVLTDLSYNDDLLLQLPGTAHIRNLIGDLYVFNVHERGRRGSHLLVDINTKMLIRKLEAPNSWQLRGEEMLGTIGSSRDNEVHILQEYGEL